MTVAPHALEYLQPDNLDLATIAESLPEPLHAGDEQTSAGPRTIYDTFDARLRADDLRLLHEDGQLKLLSVEGRELAAAAQSDTPDKLEPDQLPPPLRDRLAPVCDIRVLLRVADVETECRTLAILDDEQKTVVRLAAEQAVIRDGARRGDALRPRLHVHGVRGYDRELARVRKTLERELGLSPAPESFDDEVRARVNSAPAHLSSEAEMTPDLASDRAAVALCTQLLHVIEANLPGTLANLDTEFLHDFRVATRRTRSLLRELKTVFPPDELDHFRTEFKWLQQITGPSRDLDVYLLEFDDFTALVPEAQRDDLDLLRSVLEERQAAERRTMEAALRKPRTAALFHDWATFLAQLPSLPVDDRPDAAKPIGDLAAQRIERVYRRMVKMGRAIDDDSPHEALHDLRKKGKDLRYLLEFFSPLFSSKVTKPMVKTLKALQDTLGRFQDREVQATMLRELAAEMGSRPGAARTLMAMGVLVERLEEQQDVARLEFADRFAAFSSDDQRDLVKKTFG